MTTFVRVQNRRDTAANWSTINPVLAEGELAFETDTGRVRIGNGIDNYNDLDSFGSYAELEAFRNTIAAVNLVGAAKEIVTAADVVDVFIYDTRKDSDGGAWRKRCRHTSWYNETLNTATRGSRREFPQIALIVARLHSVTIYDLDSPDCPMWMFIYQDNSFFFRGGRPVSSVTGMNGKILFGISVTSAGGLCEVDLVADRLFRYENNMNGGVEGGRAPFNVAGRGTGGDLYNIVQPGIGSIAQEQVYDVAATVLPGTPIDPVRGLPNPTIAVATSNGVSVIHWDGRVANSSDTGARSAVQFSGDYLLSGRTAVSRIEFTRIEALVANAFTIFDYRSTNSPAVLSPNFNALTGAGSAWARGGSLGLDLIRHEAVGNGFGSGLKPSPIAYVTDKYNTGHMVGDIKMALAESAADVTSLVEATPFSDDFSTYADTAAMLAAGWGESSAGTSIALSAGGMAVGGAGSPRYGYKQVTGLVVGRRYTLKVDVTMAVAGQSLLRVDPNSPTMAGNGQTIVNATTVGASLSFVAASTTVYLIFWRNVSDANTTVFGNVRLDHTATDRSVAANHPIVKGTVTRAAVASGAELAAYGGFSGSNYLEVPYSSAFDFGTGDFCYVAWIKDPGTSTRRIFDRRLSDGSGASFLLSVVEGVASISTTGIATQTAGPNLNDGRWHMVLGQRRAGTLELWVDGVRVVSAAHSTDLNSSGAVIRIGINHVGGNPFFGSITLPRISATAPTPEQIRSMYEAERHLFQANAKCLLPGPNVSALAYDDSTDLLHVATTAGSARMRGLLVVDKDATVYTGLDAKAGIVATRDANSVDITMPTIGLREAALMGHNGGPSLYDEDIAEMQGVTVNATPTVTARMPVAEGGGGLYRITSTAREYADGAERATYIDLVRVDRPGNGNLAIVGSVAQTVYQEVTSSMAVAISVNTTTQTIDVTATGVASKNILWSHKIERLA